jgi:hypothetical protein
MSKATAKAVLESLTTIEILKGILGKVLSGLDKSVSDLI